MPKIKTLIESLEGDYKNTFEILDRSVENLGDVKILDIKDSVYAGSHELKSIKSSYIERIVIYQEKKKVRGEPWKPTLDMDLMEYLKVAGGNNNVPHLIHKAYDNGKKTIRDLIAMPYSWFESIDAIRSVSVKRGVYNWTLLRDRFKEYGIRFEKKGYVIKD